MTQSLYPVSRQLLLRELVYPSMVFSSCLGFCMALLYLPRASPGLRPSPSASCPGLKTSPRQLLMSNSSLRTFEDQVLCCICLEVLCNPVTTACRHNFCMACLHSFWDHQAAMGEMLYCPECRESFPSRPHLSKNVNLEEMVTCFTQAKGQTLQSPQKLAGPRDVTCDFCSSQKLEAIKSCLQCMVSLCEQHLHSHFEDPMFQDHQLLDPMWDLKNRLCRNHHKLQQLYCRTEGSCVCGVCLLEEHRNHDTVPLEEKRAHKEVRPGDGAGKEPGDSCFGVFHKPWRFLGGELCSY